MASIGAILALVAGTKQPSWAMITAAHVIRSSVPARSTVSASSTKRHRVTAKGAVLTLSCHVWPGQEDHVLLGPAQSDVVRDEVVRLATNKAVAMHQSRQHHAHERANQGQTAYLITQGCLSSSNSMIAWSLSTISGLTAGSPSEADALARLIKQSSSATALIVAIHVG
jgi:hypothetical protein